MGQQDADTGGIDPSRAEGKEAGTGAGPVACNDREDNQLNEILASHPAADVWPLMSPEELKSLSDDIKKNGQRLPIFVDDENRIVDGRNRWQACQLAGVNPIIERFSESIYGDVKDFIKSLNDHRRHLTREQRREIIKRLHKQGKSTRQIAKAVGVTHTTVRDDLSTGRNLPVDNQPTEASADIDKPFTKSQSAPKRLSKEQKAQVVEKLSDGENPSKIANELGVSRQAVHKIKSKPPKPEPEFFIEDDIDELQEILDGFVAKKSSRWSEKDKTFVRLFLLNYGKEIQ